MIIRNRCGLTLVELLISLSIIAIVVAAATALLNSSLQAYAYATSERSELVREGTTAMERMTQGVMTAPSVRTYWATPGDFDILVFSGVDNADDDYYFDDLLFPRIDEDDGTDMNADGSPGIKGMDDDGDGLVDESLATDNDEDGLVGEDPPRYIRYLYDPQNMTLWEHLVDSPDWLALSTRVTDFTVVDEPADTVHSRRIFISLTLTTEGGDTVVFSEYVVPRNIEQRTGKRL